MSFAMQRADAPWTGTISGVELNVFDRNLSRALDGFGGGACAPSAALIIGGAGLQLTGPFVTSGTFTVNSPTATFNENVNVLETLACQGNIDLNGDGDVSGAWVVHGNLTVDGNTTLGNGALDQTTVNGLLLCPNFLQVNSLLTVLAGGTLSCEGTANFSGNVTLGNATSDLIVSQGNATFNGSAQFNGDCFFSGSNASMRFRNQVLPDSNASFSCKASGNFYRGVSIGNPRTYTFTAANHQAGDWFVIRWQTSASNATLSDGTSTFATLRDSVSGDIVAALFVFDGTSWIKVMQELRP